MPSTAAAIGLPFDEAIDFFKQKTRIPTKGWTDVWRTAHSHGFMVAGATTDALLSDFQDAIKKALTDGTTLAEFRRDFDGIVAKHGWDYHGSPGWRSRIIYETNLSTAYSAGRYAQLTDPDMLDAFPYWRYQHSGSNHPRLQHLAWDGLTLRADDPFWDSHYPPNGWRCGCRVVPVSARGLERMGKSKPDTAPPIATRPWRNPSTGTVHHVPEGIDPGFDYNPGKAWQAGGRAIPTEAPDLVQVVPKGSLQPASPARISAFVENPEGEIPVGRLSEQVQEALGSKSDTVMLSDDTMKKQLGERPGHGGHPELTVQDYQALPTLIAQPEAVFSKDDKRLLLLGLSDKVLAVVIKATQAGDKNYVVSVHQKRSADLRAIARVQKLVLGTLDRLLNISAERVARKKAKE